jgi:hypothetical protein
MGPFTDHTNANTNTNPNPSTPFTEPTGLHNTNGTSHLGVPVLLLPGFVHFNGSEFLRYIAFVILMIVTLFFTWLIPEVARYIIRDFMGWEIKITDEKIKRQLISVAYLQKQQQINASTQRTPGAVGNSSVGPSVAESILESEEVDDDYRLKYHGITGYLRKNVFMILYTLIKLSIFCLGTWLSFSVVGQDLLLVISSLGLLGLVSAFQLFEYLRCFFAYCWIVCTASIMEGDYVMVGGESGVVTEIGFVHTILKEVNPSYELLELDEAHMMRLIPNKLHTHTTLSTQPDTTSNSSASVIPIPTSSLPQSLALLNTLQNSTSSAANYSGNPNTVPVIPGVSQRRSYYSRRPVSSPNAKSGGVGKHKPYVEELIVIQIPNWWLTGQAVRIKHQ